MSADNGLVVKKLIDENGHWWAPGWAPEYYGIFHYMGDSEYPATRKNAREAYTSPIAAILAAHVMQQEEMTEYGVSVTPDVLAEVQRFYSVGYYRLARY